MYVEVGERHSRPHFHAYYQGSAAAINIETGEILAGSLPRKQKRLVQAWTEIHYEELKKAWALLQSGELPERIQPLQ